VTDSLRDAATAWIHDDPDAQSRAELTAVLDDEAELAARFEGPLRFGTAGLRGPLRAGPNGMNLAVVRGAAAGLMAWLAEQCLEGPIVIGFDARHGSRRFAEETARVATGAGRPALLLPSPLPTPVLAHAVLVHGAAAGVMVTASHNPPEDNGYKVYLDDGAQIVPPADAGIEAAIRAVGPLSTVPLGPGPTAVLGTDAVASYVDDAVKVLATEERPRDLTIAYTPMHGVGGAVFTEVMQKAGFPTPHTVPEQAAPDPAFPTVAFPNPEEPGAMDLLLALATETGADIAIANDPDADRCAVAIPTPTGWRALRGDEVGVLLADHLMRRGVEGRYATTIVSSSLLSRMCAARGLPYGETLTGFKWIVRAGGDLVYGYEEALGYCVAPTSVRDKDGITAALLVCELAAGLKSELRTLQDRLDELAEEFGVHATDQLSVRVQDLNEITTAMSTIRSRPPTTLLDEPVTSVQDRLPESDVLIVRAGHAEPGAGAQTGWSRVVVRPSGTEPKLKAYLEVVEPVRDGDVTGARERAAASLAALRTETASALGLA
jgi:phosphomannomutase